MNIEGPDLWLVVRALRDSAKARKKLSKDEKRSMEDRMKLAVESQVMLEIADRGWKEVNGK